MPAPTKGKETTKSQKKSRSTYTSKRKILRVKKRGVIPKPTTRKRRPKKLILTETAEDLQTESQPKPLNSSSLMHRGDLFHLGDVIRVIGEDLQSYFGLISRFWADDFSEKYVEICWLVPKETIEMEEEFNPSKYIRGLNQAEPISMQGVIWVAKAESFLSEHHPVFNRCGELGKLFNENIPLNSSTSIEKFK